MIAALGIHDLWLFMATVFVLNATPGVDMVLTVSRTLQHGARGGLLAAAGIVAGCAVHAVAAAFGLAAVLGGSAAAFSVVKWIGAAYLAWLAVGMLRASLQRVDADGAHTAVAPVAAASATGAHLFRQGLLSNVLNPKVALFFLALLPQFIAAGSAHKTLAFLCLGGVVLLQSALFLLALVALASRLRSARPRPVVRRGLQGVGGVLFLGLAARLALTEKP
ncbi:LysE family translocator [Aquincola sp. MAHUQ-54]|uniref:LysE family translocator n=1 Tax=Aquincola agrisoli TaxID=3119538 RepID=A0AAW9QF59_9BURK